MLYAALFFIELFVLFLLSQQLTRQLSMVLFHKTHNKQITIVSMALLFFPGTLLHELAHYLMALLLFVKVGEMEFVPKLHGDQVKLGSVQIVKTDPVRRLFIGMAPFLSGTCLLLGLLYVAVKQELFVNHLVLLLIGYCIFEIGNTMFSSRKDMEGAIELLILIFVISIILFFTGIDLPTINLDAFLSQPLPLAIFTKGSLFLLVPLIIDILTIGLLKLIR